MCLYGESLLRYIKYITQPTDKSLSWLVDGKKPIAKSHNIPSDWCSLGFQWFQSGSMTIRKWNDWDFHWEVQPSTTPRTNHLWISQGVVEIHIRGPLAAVDKGGAHEDLGRNCHGQRWTHHSQVEQDLDTNQTFVKCLWLKFGIQKNSNLKTSTLNTQRWGTLNCLVTVHLVTMCSTSVSQLGAGPRWTRWCSACTAWKGGSGNIAWNSPVPGARSRCSSTLGSPAWRWRLRHPQPSAWGLRKWPRGANAGDVSWSSCEVFYGCWDLLCLTISWDMVPQKKHHGFYVLTYPLTTGK